MCGIAGLIAVNRKRASAPCYPAIQHRGFDDEGTWTSAPLPDGSQASLGHRRLSIIDTSAAGHQPMVSQDGRYAVTFNGRDLQTIENCENNY